MHTLIRTVVALSLAAAGLSGCQRVMYVDVEAGPDAAASSSGRTRFAVRPQPIDSAQLDQLRARAEAMTGEYLTARGDPSVKPPYPLNSARDMPRLGEDASAKVRAALAARSMTVDEAAPQFIVHVAALSGHFQYEVSPRVDKGQSFGAGRAVSPDSGRWSSWPIETHAPYDGMDTASGGNSAATDVAAIGLTIVDADGTTLLWQGTAVSVGVYSDFDRALDWLIAAVLEEWPTPTPQPKRRKFPAG
jgi:hypothetical protein